LAWAEDSSEAADEATSVGREDPVGREEEEEEEEDTAAVAITATLA
jgi:hypothetical protein